MHPTHATTKWPAMPTVWTVADCHHPGAISIGSQPYQQKVGGHAAALHVPLHLRICATWSRRQPIHLAAMPCHGSWGHRPDPMDHPKRQPGHPPESFCDICVKFVAELFSLRSCCSLRPLATILRLPLFHMSGCPALSCLIASQPDVKASMPHTQRAQDPLIQEHTLNHNFKAPII